MKMFLTLLLAGIMVLSVTFSGCGSTNDDVSAQKTESIVSSDIKEDAESTLSSDTAVSSEQESSA